MQLSSFVNIIACRATSCKIRIFEEGAENYKSRLDFAKFTEYNLGYERENMLYDELMQGTIKFNVADDGTETIERRPPTALMIRAANGLKSFAENIQGLERANQTLAAQVQNIDSIVAERDVFKGHSTLLNSILNQMIEYMGRNDTEVDVEQVTKEFFEYIKNEKRSVVPEYVANEEQQGLRVVPDGGTPEVGSTPEGT